MKKYAPAANARNTTGTPIFSARRLDDFGAVASALGSLSASWAAPELAGRLPEPGFAADDPDEPGRAGGAAEPLAAVSDNGSPFLFSSAIAMLRPLALVSRFSRCRSARISEAC